MFVSAVVPVGITGVAEFVMTGGESTWIPLWAALVGVMVWFALVWWVPSIRRLVGLTSSSSPQPDSELWRVNPGAGRTAARAIMATESLDEARAIFDAHFGSPNPIDTHWPAYALSKRMEAEGEGDDVYQVAAMLIEKGIDLTSYLPELESEFEDSPS